MDVQKIQRASQKWKSKKSNIKNGVMELWGVVKDVIRIPEEKEKWKTEKIFEIITKNIPELITISKAVIQEMERIWCILNTQTPILDLSQPRLIQTAQK